MKTLSISLVSAGLLMGAQLSAQSDEARPITLAEALQLANRESPLMVQARAAVSNSDESVRAAYSQFLPNLSLNAGASNSGGATLFQGAVYPFQGDPWNYNKGYRASITLLDGGTRWFSLRSAQSTLQANDEGELVAQFNVALSVKTQYYAALAARESQAAAERALEYSQQSKNVTDGNMRAGKAARTDSLRSAIAVGTARLAILNAQNALRSANASLTRLIGAKFTVTAVAADTSTQVHIDIDDAELQRMVDNGPAVRQTQDQFESSRSAKKATLAGNYLPTVFLGYGFNTSNTAPNFTWAGGPGNQNYSYSLSVSYNIFDNWRRESSVALANNAERVAEAQLRDARLAADESLALYLSTFRTAEQTVALQLLQVEAATADLEGWEERYRLGASSQLDVLNAQTTLDQARVTLITARFQMRTSKAQIETLIGKELP